jgi:hypothetical protein
LKLLNAPGANFGAAVAPAGTNTPESITFNAGIAALKVHPIVEGDPSNTVFATTHNFIYNTALNSLGVPYATKGFIAVRKGGDASVFKSGQATLTGWGNDCTTYQAQVGQRTGENTGTCGTTDPTGTLIYP